MITRNRRFGFRVPLEIYLDQYANERRFRGLTTDVSETGLFVETAASAKTRGPPRRVAIEFQLPGMKESIWACGEVCYAQSGDFVTGQGIRFTAMAQKHARLLREYCIESRRQHLSGLLSDLRESTSAA